MNESNKRVSVLVVAVCAVAIFAAVLGVCCFKWIWLRSIGGMVGTLLIGWAIWITAWRSGYWAHASESRNCKCGTPGAEEIKASPPCAHCVDYTKGSLSNRMCAVCAGPYWIYFKPKA